MYYSNFHRNLCLHFLTVWSKPFRIYLPPSQFPRILSKQTNMIYAKQQASSSSSSSTSSPGGSAGETSPSQPAQCSSPSQSTLPVATARHSIVSIMGEAINSTNSNTGNGAENTTQAIESNSAPTVSTTRFGVYGASGEINTGVTTMISPTPMTSIVRPGLDFPNLPSVSGVSGVIGQQPPINLTNYVGERVFGTEINTMAGAISTTTSTMADSSTSVSNLTSSNSALLRSLQEGAGPNVVPPPLALGLDPLSHAIMANTLRDESLNNVTTAAGVFGPNAGVPAVANMPAFPQVAVVQPYGAAQAANPANLGASSSRAVTTTSTTTVGHVTSASIANHHSYNYSHNGRHNGNVTNGNYGHRGSHRNGYASVGSGGPVGVCRPITVSCNGNAMLKMGMMNKGSDMDSARHPKCSKCRNHGLRVAVKSKFVHLL